MLSLLDCTVSCICRAPRSHPERLRKLSLTLTFLLHTMQQLRSMIRKFSSFLRNCQCIQDSAKLQVKSMMGAAAPRKSHETLCPLPAQIGVIDHLQCVCCNATLPRCKTTVTRPGPVVQAGHTDRIRRAHQQAG